MLKCTVYTNINVLLQNVTVYYYWIKNFAWEDQSRKQCYIADIEPDKAVIEPETCEQCYIG